MTDQTVPDECKDPERIVRLVKETLDLDIDVSQITHDPDGTARYEYPYKPYHLCTLDTSNDMYLSSPCVQCGNSVVFVTPITSVEQIHQYIKKYGFITEQSLHLYCKDEYRATGNFRMLVWKGNGE